MIILCTASDNYVEKYKPCINSQISYCKKHNYEYKLVSGKKEERNWKRSKIDELINLLKTTKKDVLLIDADCLIKEDCPRLEILLNDKSIYYANGKSGRLNSGVLYFKNNNTSLDFLKDLKEKLKYSVPRGKDYYVTKEGENGHIIWLKAEYEETNRNIFQEISKKWNCSSPAFKDEAYILHFTNDLKEEYKNYI